ncbi:class I SAM-dependent methyltransferase [Holzapfeliella sp. He02]|uniref:Class I SAM-dependent methyltransferase n=1 Tax=Holzapfeliella saturejae TaxID=3082953 RepID=A0ABU8SFJ0_9LACO
MEEQYFTQAPTSEHHYQEVSLDLNDVHLTFKTDNGVFSKNRIDYGSLALLKAITKSADFVSGILLDLGTGYGPMGLYLAKTFPDHLVHMVDVNERSLQLAKENAKTNQIDNIKIYESSCYDNVEEKFAGIATNPPIRAGKTIVSTMLKDAFDHLVPGGQLWAVLQKKQGAPSAKKLMQATFGNVKVVAKDKGYYILQSVKEA